MAKKKGPNMRAMHKQAKTGKLPEGFEFLEPASPDGWTLANEAAEFGYLPEGFDPWDLADKHWRAVEETAACCGAARPVAKE